MNRSTRARKGATWGLEAAVVTPSAGVPLRFWRNLAAPLGGCVLLNLARGSGSLRGLQAGGGRRLGAAGGGGIAIAYSS